MAVARALDNGMVVCAPLDYGSMTKTQRHICEAIKDENADESFFTGAAEKMSSLIPRGAVLVAVPDHNGWNGANRRLCAAIERIRKDTKEINALQSPRRMSVRDIKRHNGSVTPDDLMMYKFSRFVGVDNSPVAIIDNVIDTGVTMLAAQSALGCECIGVAYAMTDSQDNSVNNSNKGEKKMEKTTKTIEKNGKTYLVCGNCGAEIPLPEHTHFTAGMSLAADSGLGRVVLPTIGSGCSHGESARSGNINDSRTTMEQNSNFDMGAMMQMFTQMMSMMTQNPEMKSQMVETVKKTFGVEMQPAAPKASHEQMRDITERRSKMLGMKNTWIEKGYHNHLYRQMFEEFGLRLENGVCKENFTKHINSLGYEYSWEQMRHVIETMLTIEKKDPDEFKVMYRCFIAEDTPLLMAEWWLVRLSAWIQKKCKKANGRRKGADGHVIRRGEYYRTEMFSRFDRELSKGVFVDEFEERVVDKFESAIQSMRGTAGNFREFAEAFFAFDDMRSKVAFHTKVDTTFKEAFKLWGAWCVIDILVSYDGVVMFDCMDMGQDVGYGDALTESESYRMLHEMLWRKNNDGTYHYKGFMMLGVLKQLIERNGFDYEDKKAAYLAGRNR